MNRVPYRRVTPSKNAGNPPPRSAQNSEQMSEQMSIKDNLIIQLTISAILALCLLVICLTSAPWATDLQGEISHALQGPTTYQQLLTSWQDIWSPPQAGTQPLAEPFIENEDPVTRIPIHFTPD